MDLAGQASAGPSEGFSVDGEVFDPPGGAAPFFRAPAGRVQLPRHQSHDHVIADKAYSHPSTRVAMRARGIAFTSPEKSDQIARRQAKGSRGGRPPAFDADRYADRNVVERCFNRLKQFRALATRYAKRVAYYRSEIIIATIVLWLRADLQDTP